MCVCVCVNVYTCTYIHISYLHCLCLDYNSSSSVVAALAYCVILSVAPSKLEASDTSSSESTGDVFLALIFEPQRNVNLETLICRSDFLKLSY